MSLFIFLVFQHPDINMKAPLFLSVALLLATQLMTANSQCMYEDLWPHSNFYEVFKLHCYYNG